MLFWNAAACSQYKVKWISAGKRSKIFPISSTKWWTESHELGCPSTCNVNCFNKGDDDNEWKKRVSTISTRSPSEQSESFAVK